MEERIRFVKDERSGLCTMSELCEPYGINRKTGYKLLRRFEAERAAGWSIAAERRGTASTT
jgi:transposase